MIIITPNGYTHKNQKLKEDNTNDKSDDNEGFTKFNLALKKNLRIEKIKI